MELFPVRPLTVLDYSLLFFILLPIAIILSGTIQFCQVMGIIVKISASNCVCWGLLTNAWRYNNKNTSSYITKV